MRLYVSDVRCVGSYLVDISEVPDFNTMYELYDPVTVMFFFRCDPVSFPADSISRKMAVWCSLHFFEPAFYAEAFASP